MVGLVVYFFNGISIPHGLFKTEIWFICKYFIVIITIFKCSTVSFKNLSMINCLHTVV